MLLQNDRTVSHVPFRQVKRWRKHDYYDDNTGEMVASDGIGYRCVKMTMSPLWGRAYQSASTLLNKHYMQE